MARFWPFWTEKAVLASFFPGYSPRSFACLPPFGGLVMQGKRASYGPWPLIVPLMIFCLLVLGCAGQNSQNGGGGPSRLSCLTERKRVRERDWRHQGLQRRFVLPCRGLAAKRSRSCPCRQLKGCRYPYRYCRTRPLCLCHRRQEDQRRACPCQHGHGNHPGPCHRQHCRRPRGRSHRRRHRCGLGVTAADADTEYTWQLDCDVTMRRRGEKANPLPYSTTASATNMERQDAEYALKNQLSVDMVNSLRAQ